MRAHNRLGPVGLPAVKEERGADDRPGGSLFRRARRSRIPHPRRRLDRCPNRPRRVYRQWRAVVAALDQRPFTNDLAAHRSAELTANGIRANLVLLREPLPERILLLGLLPRERSPDAPLRRAAAEVNSLIRGCADGQHICLRRNRRWLDSEGELSAAVSPDCNSK